jgi:hypothetical protein
MPLSTFLHLRVKYTSCLCQYQCFCKAYIMVSKYIFSIGLHLCVNKCFFVYPYIKLPQNATLYIPILLLSRMPLSIFLYFYLKWCTSVYVYVRVSVYGSIYMLILWLARIHVSKCIHVVLTNAPMCIPLSASLSFPLSIYVYTYVFKDTCIHMPLFDPEMKPISVCPYRHL